MSCQHPKFFAMIPVLILTTFSSSLSGGERCRALLPSHFRSAWGLLRVCQLVPSLEHVPCCVSVYCTLWALPPLQTSSLFSLLTHKINWLDFQGFISSETCGGQFGSTGLCYCPVLEFSRPPLLSRILGGPKRTFHFSPLPSSCGFQRIN